MAEPDHIGGTDTCTGVAVISTPNRMDLMVWRRSDGRPRGIVRMVTDFRCGESHGQQPRQPERARSRLARPHGSRRHVGGSAGSNRRRSSHRRLDPMARWHRTRIAVASRLWSGHGFCRFDYHHTSEDGVCGGPGTFSSPLGAITRCLVPAWSPSIRRSPDRRQVDESAAYSQSAWAMVLQAAAPKTLATVVISLVLMFTGIGVRAAELDASSLHERADFFGETAADTRADPITAALAAYTRHVSVPLPTYASAPIILLS